MREALRGLTLRGRGFLAAGVTALVCALFLGHDELVRVGVLLVVLPLVTAFFLGRSRYRLGLVRTMSPTQVSAGQQARVQLDLNNDGRTPTGTLLLEDHIPYVLGTRPRFVVDRMGPKWKRHVDYQVRSDVRGRFVVGPMRVRLSDPFGLVELDRTFQSTSTLVVTPRVVPLPPVPISGAWTGSGDNRPRAFASGSAEDVTVREYRRGDDLRRVHWRSSAHAGELMVRREEQPWQSRATLFVDNRRFAHRGVGAASSFEHAVSVAASVAVHLVQRGFSVRLVTASGEQHGGTWHEHGTATAETAPLLESLAVLGYARRRTPRRPFAVRGRSLGPAGRRARRPRGTRHAVAAPDAARGGQRDGRRARRRGLGSWRGLRRAGTGRQTALARRERLARGGGRAAGPARGCLAGARAADPR